MSGWPAAVFFDFDGVLVNSEPLHFQALAKVLADDHLQLTEDEYYAELLGFDDRGCLKHFFKKRNLELKPGHFLELLTRKSEVVMELIYQKRFGALPGVEEFVRTLWRRCPLAICSGALREEIEAILEGIALRDCFPIITAAEDVAVGKPDPSGYLQTMKKVSEKMGRKLEPRDCLIIEDAPTVIHEVRAVGFPVIGVATSHPVEKLTEANWAVKSLNIAEVHKAVPKLGLSE
jgi:HAD superfamily hydrolase (TIGR01509 family)